MTGGEVYDCSQPGSLGVPLTVSGQTHLCYPLVPLQHLGRHTLASLFILSLVPALHPSLSPLPLTLLQPCPQSHLLVTSPVRTNSGWLWWVPDGLSFQCCYLTKHCTIYWCAEYQLLLMAASHGYLGPMDTWVAKLSLFQRLRS